MTAAVRAVPWGLNHDASILSVASCVATHVDNHGRITACRTRRVPSYSRAARDRYPFRHPWSLSLRSYGRN